MGADIVDAQGRRYDSVGLVAAKVLRDPCLPTDCAFMVPFAVLLVALLCLIVEGEASP